MVNISQATSQVLTVPLFLLLFAKLLSKLLFVVLFLDFFHSAHKIIVLKWGEFCIVVPLLHPSDHSVVRHETHTHTHTPMLCVEET